MKNKLIEKCFNGILKPRLVLVSGLLSLTLVFVVGLSQSVGSYNGSSSGMNHLSNIEMQQNIEVSGVVTDAATGERLVGVTVVIKGTTIGTTTNIDGNYTISITDPSQVLVFAFVGYEDYEAEVGDQRTINISLSPSITVLDETVVIGYGTQRRGDITGSVSSIGERDFQRGSVRDVAHLIQGRTAGLRVGVTSGDPTATSQISLRGITTLTGDANPLVIIDGVPGNINTVAPQDVESVNILKDGAAAAIYGTRGSNGVILITTRRPKEDVTVIEHSSYIGIQSIASQPDFMDADEYRRYINHYGDEYDYGYSTDWLSEITRNNPINHTHNLLLQGSHGNSNYTASLNYRNWEGLFLRSDNEELRTRLEANHSMLDDRLRINTNLTVRHQSHWAGSDGGSFNNWIYKQALQRNPTDRIKDDEGNWQERPFGFFDNPMGLIMETDGENVIRNIRLSGNLIFQPIDNLNMQLLLSRNTNNGTTGFTQTRLNNIAVRAGREGFASRRASSSEDLLAEFTTEYNYKLSEHQFTVLGGYSFQDRSWENFNLQNWDFPTDEYSYHNMGTGNALMNGQANMSSYKASSRLIGFFGRINYNYQDRYLLMASLRREGSSRFGRDHQWGTFPSISGGWRISHEPFLQDAIGELFDNLMIRVGYGLTGIEPQNPYLAHTTLNYGARFFYQGDWIQGLEPGRNPNPQLRWEEKEEINIGLELSMFDYRFEASFDIYQRNTKDLLWNFSVPVPPFLYGSMIANVGEIENKGFEAFLMFVPVRNNNFNWRSNVSYSTNTNKLVSLSDDTFQTEHDFFNTGYFDGHVREATHRVQIGGPIGDFWGYKSVDIDDNGRWIIETPEGEIVPYDQTTTDDKQVLGNGIPSHVLSWNNQFFYRQFDLEISMRGAFDFQILNEARVYWENPLEDRYRNKLASAMDDVYGKTILNNEAVYVSYYIEDGDYWKIDNITLGYNFDPSVINPITRARIYFSIQNAITITGYKGIDPEVNFSGLSPGKDARQKFPTTRTLTLGINLNF